MTIEFNEDGSLKISKNLQDEVDSLEKEIPAHVHVLKLVEELEFPVGRKLLSEVLRGERNTRIRKLGLNNLLNHAALDLYEYRDIYELLDKMVMNGLIEIAKLPQSRYMPVVKITSKGKKELEDPTEDEFGAFSSCLSRTTQITDKDREVFKNLDFFLGKFNEEQKKAIIDNNPKALCIAGAGSGKTTVLTKRIEFLVKYKNVDSGKILAITFTRKARREMMHRLSELIPGHEVQIETFNSFSEKILKKHSSMVYEKDYRVMSYSDKIRSVNYALNEIGYSSDEAIELYFSDKKVRSNDRRKLFFIFVNDVFSLMDNYKYNENSISVIKDIIAKTNNMSERRIGEFVYKVIERVLEYKRDNGFRDYTDQLIHTIGLFQDKSSLIPVFKHVLVDEYQDVNNIQVKLLDLLSPENLFVVGDPRQSIYGWRGSKVENILKFPQKHSTCSVIQLTKNYRSSQSIVDVANKVISSMELPDIESAKGPGKPVVLVRNSDENTENVFISQSILSQDVSRKEIFVLARTNKQLESVAKVFDEHSIRYLMRTEEQKKENQEPDDDQITLSTVHAIKGLEATIVYMVGVDSQMYPCMASDHPVLNIIKLDDDYDKFAEELRLLYVGLTRAKEQLVVCYHNTLSSFLRSDVKKLMTFIDNSKLSLSGTGKKVSTRKKYKKTGDAEGLFERLRVWRLERSRELGLRPYHIFPDVTLNQLVEKKPTDFYDLQNISGIGPNKVVKFGQDIIDIINGLF